MRSTTKPDQQRRSPWPLAVTVLTLGILCLCGVAHLVNDGPEGIFPWQLTKLRWLLIASGVWLVTAGTTLFVDHLLHRHPSNIPGSPRRSKPRLITLILLVLVVGAPIGQNEADYVGGCEGLGGQISGHCRVQAAGEADDTVLKAGRGHLIVDESPQLLLYGRSVNMQNRQIGSSLYAGVAGYGAVIG